MYRTLHPTVRECIFFSSVQWTVIYTDHKKAAEWTHIYGWNIF